MDNMRGLSFRLIKENNPNFFINVDQNNLNEWGSRVIGEYLFFKSLQIWL